MTKDFDRITTDDTIYFVPSDGGPMNSMVVRSIETVDDYSSHGFGGALTRTEFIGVDDKRISVKNVRAMTYESIRTNDPVSEIPPDQPVSKAVMNVGDKTIFGFATTTNGIASVLEKVFKSGCKHTQEIIKQKYFEFLDAVGVERPYQPPRVLR